ncbi:MAG: T9SS type A sorting domain-containing protein [Bacteroidales bacterium]
MMKKILPAVIFLFSLQWGTVSAQNDYIIFTAYQDFVSRLYVLEMDGSIADYHEYVNYRLLDMVVIDNEVYVTDAFIPCVYKVDIFTGELELVLHDLWLFYFYGVAWDGTYFYVDEWDLNRYDMNGDKDGTADFDEDVMGADFANGYYWMLNNENQIKCWDFAGWPDVVEMPENNFSPPTPECRGLWYDGQYFWTAESIESNLGKIYKFDFEGEIIDEWTAPAFQGWGACRVQSPVEVHEMAESAEEFTISPNPVRDHALISVRMEHAGTVTLKLYDLSGRMISAEEFYHHQGKQQINWRVPSAADAGLYLLGIETPGKTCCRKIVVRK